MSEFSLHQEYEGNRRLRSGISWLVDILVVAALAVFLVNALGNTREVSGRSMEPTLSPGDTVLVDTLHYLLFPVQRYDVVLFTSDTDSGRSSIKRVIGLPGETVQIADGVLYVDGSILDDETPSIPMAGLAASPVTLGEDEYFLLGDNGNSSEDSRFSNVGNVRQSQIEGRVWFLLSPLESLGFVR